MLATPLGPIHIYSDGACMNFKAIEYVYDRHPCKNKPVAGCYRIEVDTVGRKEISCVVDLACPKIRNTGDSGQGYLNAEFIQGETILTIGIEDENQAFESVRIEYGLQCNLLQPLEKVVFGIAWATDYAGSHDVRTWYAADPTLK